jgi:hypothetical protein
MHDNLRLYDQHLRRLRQLVPEERITRVRNLALLVSGLIQSGSVHLSHIARQWPTAAKLPSLENRLRRFLCNSRLSVPRLYRPVARRLLERFQVQGSAGRAGAAPIRLILDVTQVGPAARLLSLSLAYKKRALPLCWSVHRGVKGHVQAEHAITLLEQIRPLLTPDAQVWVLGDSGFGQIELMRYLRAQGWHFVLRLHGHYSVQTSSADWVRLCDHRLREAETRALGRVALTAKHGYRGAHVVLHWAAGEEEPWYLASDQPLGRTMVRHYRVRMWTEELYGDLKGHGFDLEATHLRAPERLERLILGVCLAYTGLLVLGARVVKRGLRHLVDRKHRRDKSYFRIGWDYLAHRLRLGEPVPPIRFQPCL